MDASAWIALTSLALVIFVQAAAIAFVLGGLFRDVKTLREQSSEGDCSKELAVLNTRFAAMEELVKELGHDIKNLLTGQVVPARRVRAARE
jgi:hypothetical protein